MFDLGRVAAIVVDNGANGLMIVDCDCATTE
jgi:hypothetical protein